MTKILKITAGLLLAALVGLVIAGVVVARTPTTYNAPATVYKAPVRVQFVPTTIAPSTTTTTNPPKGPVFIELPGKSPVVIKQPPTLPGKSHVVIKQPPTLPGKSHIVFY